MTRLIPVLVVAAIRPRTEGDPTVTSPTIPNRSTDSRQDDPLHDLIAAVQAHSYGGTIEISFGGDDGWNVQWYEAHPDDEDYLRVRSIESCPTALGDALREAIEIIQEARS